MSAGTKDEAHLADIVQDLLVQHSYSRYLGGLLSPSAYDSHVDLQVIELPDEADPDAEPYRRHFLITVEEIT